ncbi:MAG: TIGR03790 family protein [Verrucomicrobia bacterium]|nr:TIGR03790 family protein [Verrucomicrobiota bacterium]
MHSFKSPLSLFVLLVSALTSVAANPGDEVVVIYNSRMRESKAVADYYAKQRNVPASQVFGFDMVTSESMSRAEFRNSLQEALAKKLTSEKLWTVGPKMVVTTNGQPATAVRSVLDSKIRYVVLCYGVPLKILPDPTLRELQPTNARPEFMRNEAAVDSDLACLPQTLHAMRFSGPLQSPFYSVTNAGALSPTNGILMVARLDGPTPEIARGLVDKALQAERDGLHGRAYFDLRKISDPGYKIGDEWIRNASEICRALGYDIYVDESGAPIPASFPMSQIAFYEGWYTENVFGPFTLPEVEFMPGAFAYHLHSFSASSLRLTNRSWVGPLLLKGATCTMGCVDEPYLAATPDVGAFTGRFVHFGFTFGEAAYASQPVLSWQTTVVGDPLYRPFGKPLQQLHEELEARGSKLAEWCYVRIINLNRVRGVALNELASVLERVPLAKTSSVMSEKLGDLCTAQGKPSSAILNYERALTLDVTPQQRIRLRLTLGEKLLAAGRDEDAYNNYKNLAGESPDYADRLINYQKLVTLAIKLGKKDEAEKFQEQVKRLQ